MRYFRIWLQPGASVEYDISRLVHRVLSLRTILQAARRSYR